MTKQTKELKDRLKYGRIRRRAAGAASELPPFRKGQIWSRGEWAYVILRNSLVDGRLKLFSLRTGVAFETSARDFFFEESRPPKEERGLNPLDFPLYRKYHQEGEKSE